jgi:hypothetical protein
LLPEGWTGGVPTPDGRFVTAQAPDASLPLLHPLDGGEPKPIPGIRATDVILEFAADGTEAFVRETWRRWVRLDLRTGRRSPWVEPKPLDPTGMAHWMASSVHPSGRYYAYSYERVLSDLYLIEGLK